MESERTNTIFLIAANVGALVLLIGAVYMIKTLTLVYGIAVGAVVQSVADNSTITAVAQQAASQLGSLHTGIYETYVVFLVALILAAATFIMFLRRNDKNGRATVKRYTLLAGAFTIVYVMLLFFLLSDFSAYLHFSYYIYLIYAGAALTLACIAALELFVVRQPSEAQKFRSSISMDPSKPFSNMVAIQDQLFSNLNGYLRVIDKHFNSSSLANFHRLIDRHATNFTKIVILTSKEMLDSDLQANFADFRNELTAAGVGLEVKLMDDKDAVDQHERILMDEKVAYKIPPFNIINKRSEHITKMSFADAQRRFDYLYGRAIKLENYAVKRARQGPSNPEQPSETA